MSCPTGIIQACDFPQFLVNQTPKFDEMIIEDIRPTDGWLLNISTGTTPMGTPPEITQDRFRSVYPNVTKAWRKVVNQGAGCSGNPCDPPEHQIGWGADRLTYYLEAQEWQTPLLCYDQDMHITAAEQHIAQIISEILRPATTYISSVFLRKRALLWAKKKWAASLTQYDFTYQWTLGGPNGDEEIYFDCSSSPSTMSLLTPPMLQSRFSPLMRKGYSGKNPFKDTAPNIELVTDMDTAWTLDRLGGNQANGGNLSPSVSANWRFTEWSAAHEFWRYGFSGQIGNFLVRVDELGLRFNFLQDLGAGANGGNGNRYRYQVVLPWTNVITSGAGGAAGLGSDVNLAFDKAQFSISFIWHKMAMELLVPDSGSLNPETPFAHRDFGGKWQFVMDNLGADVNGIAINNKRRNKGQFIADFRYYLRPLHTEFAEAIFHMREQMIVTVVLPQNPSPGYPAQSYNSALPTCPLPGDGGGNYPTGWPANTGPIPIPTTNLTTQGVTVPVVEQLNPVPAVNNAFTLPPATPTNPPDQ
jgi:hypothetical protein